MSLEFLDVDGLILKCLLGIAPGNGPLSIRSPRAQYCVYPSHLRACIKSIANGWWTPVSIPIPLIRVRCSYSAMAGHYCQWKMTRAVHLVYAPSLQSLKEVEMEYGTKGTPWFFGHRGPTELLIIQALQLGSTCVIPTKTRRGISWPLIKSRKRVE